MKKIVAELHSDVWSTANPAGIGSRIAANAHNRMVEALRYTMGYATVCSYSESSFPGILIEIDPGNETNTEALREDLRERLVALRRHMKGVIPSNVPSCIMVKLKPRSAA